MLNFLYLKRVFFFCLLSAMHCLTKGTASDNFDEMLSTTTNGRIQRENEKLNLFLRHKSSNSHPNRSTIDLVLKREKQVRALKVADFAGRWYLNVVSVGGVDGGIGTSKIGEGIVIFNKKGLGVVKHFTGVVYSGTPSQVSNFDFSGTTTNIQITDPILGLGTLSNPAFDEQFTVPFIAIRSIDLDGVVIEFRGHSTITNLSTTSLIFFSYIRQLQ